MRRIVVHPGFHKTGTTTAQAVIHRNRELLWPSMALGLKWRMGEVLAAARAYSTWRDPISLEAFRARFDRFLAGLDLGEKRGLLISAEELSGHLPGRGDLADYSAAPDLMAEVRGSVLRAYPDAHLAFVVTTRKPGDWLPSAYWEHVKSSRMVLDWDEFRTRYADAAKLSRAARAIARAVAPAPVREWRLEEVGGHRLGPASPLFDAMAVPDDLRARLGRSRAATSARGRTT